MLRAAPEADPEQPLQVSDQGQALNSDRPTTTLTRETRDKPFPVTDLGQPLQERDQGQAQKATHPEQTLQDSTRPPRALRLPGLHPSFLLPQ